MSYASIGTSNSDRSPDINSAKRTFRCVEKQVLHQLDVNVGICKDVKPYYIEGRSPSDGNFRRLSDCIGERSDIVIAADRFIGTILGQFIQGIAFPGRFLYERSLNFLQELCDCTDPSVIELFVNLKDELEALSKWVRFSRRYRQTVSSFDFRRKLFEHFDNVVSILQKISKQFRIRETSMDMAARRAVYVTGYITVPVQQFDQLNKTAVQTVQTLGVVNRKLDEAIYYVSQEERGKLRSEKTLAGDVRSDMENDAFEAIKAAKHGELSHRQAARDTIADYDGVTGAYTNSKPDIEALRKRIDRRCDAEGLKG